MRYTISDLRADFPDDNACLQWLVDYLYPNGITCPKCQKITKHHRIKSRRSYSCDRCGHHVHPTAGTIFHKSTTPLTLWFYAVYLMASTRSGISSKQLERELGVTYKTAWRMMHQIRSMMSNEEGQLSGEVEVDETYVHPNVFKRSTTRKIYGRTGMRTGEVILGMVERGGKVKVQHIKTAGARIIHPLILANVKPGTIIHTDGYLTYRRLPKMGYEHHWTDHGRYEFYREDSHTQNIENVWSHFKRGIKGVYRHVSPKYLQNYANEYAFRYNYRNTPSMFWSLIGRVEKQ